jgi:hypothetical protein
VRNIEVQELKVSYLHVQLLAAATQRVYFMPEIDVNPSEIPIASSPYSVDSATHHSGIIHNIS